MLQFDPRLIRTLAIMHSSVLLKFFLIFVGYKGGKWIDAHFGTDPIFTLLLACLGAVIGLAFIIFSIMRATKRRM